jgi:hypothetical protein
MKMLTESTNQFQVTLPGINLIEIRRHLFKFELIASITFLLKIGHTLLHKHSNGTQHVSQSDKNIQNVIDFHK